MTVELYTVEEVAEIVKITPYSIRTHINKGLLKAHKIGREWRVTKEDLEKYLKGE